jgi:hypothetical protein
MLVHIIADYGQGDLAFAEVVQRFKLHLPDAEPVLTPVPAFSTLAAGFCVAQLGLNEAPPDTLIYHNVAPRADEDEARSENEGERLAYARLTTGVQVVGVSAGEAFSFVRDEAEELRWVDVPAEGSQFRSRDLFPAVAAEIARGKADKLAAAIPPAHIPDVPPNRIAYVDGYGNLKTTIKFDSESMKVGTRLHVRIGRAEREAVISDGTFAVEPGEMSFAPGSSGWPSRGGGEVRWVELFLRGGNAWESFGCPSVGNQIEVEEVKLVASR